MSENIENQEMSYEKAVAELNSLVEKVEGKNASFAEIEADIKRAMELIRFCKDELKGYKERFDKLQEEK
ncbi:MAG: exodeoxyribonuclease VII small subunit [Candidatus Egerieousia sp.]